MQFWSLKYSYIFQLKRCALVPRSCWSSHIGKLTRSKTSFVTNILVFKYYYCVRKDDPSLIEIRRIMSQWVNFFEITNLGLLQASRSFFPFTNYSISIRDNPLHDHGWHVTCEWPNTSLRVWHTSQMWHQVNLLQIGNFTLSLLELLKTLHKPSLVSNYNSVGKLRKGKKKINIPSGSKS